MGANKHADLRGRRFGRLTVLIFSFTDSAGCARWQCLCDCGNEKYVPTHRLNNGNTKSCGCLSRELSAKRLQRHGLARSREYRLWANMRKRCENPKHKSFNSYGARGITVCDQWRNSFETFLTDVGPRPSLKHSIDRIDNSRGYEPGNVRWATAAEQQNNRRCCIYFEAFGKRKTLTQWAREYGISPGKLWRRVRINGLPMEQALTQEVPQ